MELARRKGAVVWLYVPTYSHSAPEAEGLTWDLESRVRLLALFVTWNGKLSPPRLGELLGASNGCAKDVEISHTG